MTQPITIRHGHTDDAPAVLSLDFFGNIHHEPLSFKAIAEQLMDVSIVSIQIVVAGGIRSTLDKHWIAKDIHDVVAVEACMKAARKAFGRTGKPFAVRYGKGVMSKDGRTPYAAGTLHAESADGWNSPYHFNHAAFAQLLADETTAVVDLIDVDNVRVTIRKKWIATKTPDVAARLAA